MIVGSLLLILVAIALLVFGLASGSSGLLISSIAASLLAAVALVAGARQAAAGRTAGGGGGGFTGRGRSMPSQAVPERVEPDESIPEQPDDPPDEPGVQRSPADAAARVAGLADQVLVVDGRPRYHLADCPHLTGRSAEALPVREAIGFGFTPCAVCEPDTALVADR